MQHYLNDRHDHFGRIHSFAGEAKEVYELIKILIHDGVGFKFLPTHDGHCVVSFISEESYQGLIERGRIHLTSD